MKIGLEVKNSSKIFKPSKGDVIVFDGQSWYVTTKEDILKEANKTLELANRKLEEIDAYRAEISSQMAELGEIVRRFVQSQGE